MGKTVASVMLKEFEGKELKTPRGSLRSLRVLLPVLMTVAVTFKFSKPSTLTLGAEALTAKPGPAETAIAEATMATREARREENIVTYAMRWPAKPRTGRACIYSLPILTQVGFIRCPGQILYPPGQDLSPRATSYAFDE